MRSPLYTEAEVLELRSMVLDHYKAYDAVTALFTKYIRAKRLILSDAEYNKLKVTAKRIIQGETYQHIGGNFLTRKEGGGMDVILRPSLTIKEADKIRDSSITAEELAAQLNVSEDWAQKVLDGEICIERNIGGYSVQKEEEEIDPEMIVEAAPEGYLVLSQHNQLPLYEVVVICYKSWEVAWPFVYREALNLEGGNLEFRVYEVWGEKLSPDFTSRKVFRYQRPGQTDSIEEQTVLTQCVVQPIKRRHIRSIRVNCESNTIIIEEM